MKKIFDDISFKLSRSVTKSYSTSFSVSVRLLSSDLRQDIYNIYGFVRCADEIVDSFHSYDQPKLLEMFKNDFKTAFAAGISMNPIINSFQHTVKKHDIPLRLIDSFFHSMELDLVKRKYYSSEQLTEYIFGSAEVIGLMCLKIFVNGDDLLFENLKPSAMKLGSAFQKINFLRDIGADMSDLNRTYFPELVLATFDESSKILILKDIERDLKAGLEGIKNLPLSARFGVYIAYIYFNALLVKLKRYTLLEITSKRVRINNFKKSMLFFKACLLYKFRC